MGGETNLRTVTRKPVKATASTLQFRGCSLTMLFTILYGPPPCPNSHLINSYQSPIQILSKIRAGGPLIRGTPARLGSDRRGFGSDRLAGLPASARLGFGSESMSHFCPLRWVRLSHTHCILARRHVHRFPPVFNDVDCLLSSIIFNDFQ